MGRIAAPGNILFCAGADFLKMPIPQQIAVLPDRLKMILAVLELIEPYSLKAAETVDDGLASCLGGLSSWWQGA